MSEAVTIGTATLYWGDAYEIRPTLGFMDADVMDPPYLFDNSGGGAYRKARGASDRIVADGLDQGFDHKIINPLMNGSVVTFCHNDQLADLLPYIAGLYRRYVVMFWAKPSPPPHRNKHFLADTEPFIFAWNEGFHPVGAHHDMHRLVEAPSMPSKTYNHPTVKPDKVMNKIITNVNGDRVCDPFMGTGSTGVAAVRSGKSFFGIEKDRSHFDTACKRIEAAWSERASQ